MYAPLLSLLLLYISVNGYTYDPVRTNDAYYPYAIAASASDQQKCLSNLNLDVIVVKNVSQVCDTIPLVGSITTYAYLGTSAANKEVIISFRGTDQALELYVETIAFFTQQTEIPGVGNVNSFFYECSTALYDSMGADLRQQLKLNPTYNATFIGHSLGGALASIAAAFSIVQQDAAGSNIKLITFGEPRTGDTNFTNFINSEIPYVYRVVHNQDPVPHQPPLVVDSCLNYDETSSEIWYYLEESDIFTYKTCVEENITQCSDTLEALIPLELYSNIDDHICYMGTDIKATAAQGCTTRVPCNSCPPGWVQDALDPKICYKAIESPNNNIGLGYFYAAYECLTIMPGSQTSLVSIDNAFQNNYMKTVTGDLNNACGGNFYLGLFELPVLNQWIWINGDNSTYRNWQSGQPSSFNCAYWEYSSTKWYSTNCTINNCYICELALV